MNMAFPPCLNRTEWKTLYRAAILETDQSLSSQRVSEAEEAVIERGGEVFYDHGAAEEKDALDDALYEQIECWLDSPQPKQKPTRRKPSLKKTTAADAGIPSRTWQGGAFCALK
jgi:hypothetical protein